MFVVRLATNYCVLATALDAAASGRCVTVLREGIRAVDRNPGAGERAFETLRAAGVEIE
jgi:nicotinamidase/pyrazinamidase